MTVVRAISRTGLLPPPPKMERNRTNQVDGKIKDLNTLTRFELVELQDRQLKLLSNKPFISKLPDKGEKIRTFCQKIEEKLSCQREEESVREMLEKLNLNTLVRESVQTVEWKGKMQLTQNTYLDSDDDSEPEDVLNVLRQNTSHERKVRILKEDQSLITSRDLEEISPPDQMNHIKYIVNKTENVTPKLSGQFKPYKTTRTDVHDPKKEGARKQHKHWEVTAATPPPFKHSPAQVLSIEESLRLQTEQNQHLKEVETRHAAEKLLQRVGVDIGDVPESAQTSGRYRDRHSDDSDVSAAAEGSDNEVYDEEPERGGVVFTVMK